MLLVLDGKVNYPTATKVSAELREGVEAEFAPGRETL
jgi:hypothetical protein